MCCLICGTEITQIKKKHINANNQKRKREEEENENPVVKKSRLEINVDYCQFLMENDILSKGDEIANYFYSNHSATGIERIYNNDTLRKNYVVKVYFLYIN